MDDSFHRNIRLNGTVYLTRLALITKTMDIQFIVSVKCLGDVKPGLNNAMSTEISDIASSNTR